ncbi:MAG: RNA polymerase factor sigma-54 [Peptostreptococcaceae bacterium]
MNLDFNLNLSQQQKLVMTQNMQLSINILQMSAFELREFINKELEENPTIESDFNLKKETEIDQYKKMVESMDYDNSNYNSYSKGEYNEEGVSPLNFVSEKKTLKNYLYEQVQANKSIKNIRSVIDYMIESLDNRGYLDETVEIICNKFNISQEKCGQALEILQSLEPSGIGARNLQECLNIQLRKEEKLDVNLESIINNYLELVADNKFKDISKYLNITQLEAQNYGDVIRTLEPKPSRGYYTGDEVKFITPDAYIKRIDEEYTVIMNNDVVPQLSVNGAYKNLLLHGEDKEVENYIKEKIGSAMFLIKSINNRENTLRIILEDIINRQKEYLDKGKKYLKPMMLKDIAEDINMHESTVSRAIKDKYILTSYGTVRIKDLFTVGYSTKKSSDSKDISAKNIKDIIKEIIDKEDKKKPFSDEMVCTELSKKNLNISRRTVAKYREEMGIKSSSKRKRI